MSTPLPNPCGTCGACCRRYVVQVCGYDVWLLSTQQRLAPQQFCIAMPSPVFEAIRFRLGVEDTNWYELALDKRGPFKLGRPCVFLMDLGAGESRCGVYNERPLVCRTYPMAEWSNIVYQRRHDQCPPGAWPLRAVTHPQWRVDLQWFQLRFDIYREVVGRWNARIASRPHLQFALPDFYTYLMNVYEQLAQLDSAVGPDALGAIAAEWPMPPHSPFLSGTVEIRAGQYPWLDYLLAARQIIDGFYPDVPALPLITAAPA